MRSFKDRRLLRAVCGIESLEARRLLAAVVNDQTVTSTIGSASEVDSYTFTGAVGDTIFAVISETTAGSAFDPQLKLLNPSGTAIELEYGEDGADLQFALTVAGNYTLEVSDAGSNDAGGYALTVAKLPGTMSPNDGDGGTLTSGNRRTGTISLGDFDVYTVTAAVGDQLRVTLAEETDTAFDPALFIYDPTGGFVEYEYSINAASASWTASTGGTYYIVAADEISEYNSDFDTDSDTGVYSITMARIPAVQTDDAGEGGPITSGARRTGNLPVGDMDTFTFSASAGDYIILTVAETASATDAGFEPSMLVYNPSGALVDFEYGLSAADAEFTAVAGTYFVVVTDYIEEYNSDYDVGGAPGAYTFNMVRAPASQTDDTTDGGAVTSGNRKYGTTTLGDLDVFTMTASTGDYLMFTTAETGGDTPYDPAMWVIGPTGSLIDFEYSITGVDAEFSAPASGTYYIVVGDYIEEYNGDYDTDADTGTYSFNAVRVPAVPTDDGTDGGALTSGPRKFGSISLGDLDVYTITGAVGDQMMLNVVENGGQNFDPSIWAFGPNGALLDFEYSETGADVQVTATTAGTYYFVVGDYISEYNGDYDVDADAGSYILTTAILPKAQTDDSTDGGALTSGVQRTGTLSFGDIDVYTMSLTAGNSIYGVIAPPDSGYQAIAWLYGPTGTLLDSSNGTNNFVVNANNVSATGTYYLVIQDNIDEYNGDLDTDAQSGEYALTVGIAPASQPTDADSGVLVSGTPRQGSLPRGDLDVYTFTVPAGSFTLKVGDTAADAFVPRVAVYNSTGALVGNNANGTTATVTYNAPAGTYTAFVLDSEGNNAGSYSIALNTDPAADNFKPYVFSSAYRFDAVQAELRVQFSEDVGASIVADDITITNLDTNTPVDLAGLQVVYNATYETLHVTFPAFDYRVLPDGNYRLTINHNNVEDASGNLLAADLSLDFYTLAGDVNRDRVVNFNDLLVIAQNYGKWDMPFSQGNVDYSPDGLINFSDLLILAQQYGTSLPALRPASPFSSRRISQDVLDI